VSDGELILVAGSLLVLGLAAVLIADRLRVPGLVIFLGLGMLIGSDGLGWIDFSDAELTRTIGIVALSLILFEGGLAAGWQEIRPVLSTSLSLAFVGTLLTAAIAGFAAAWIFDLSTLEGLLVGATIAATDSAAIFSVLRGSTLKRRLARVLEAESGLNDPIAVLLVVGFIDWIQLPDYGLLDEVWLFVRQIGIGLAVGLAAGGLGVWTFRRINFATPGLYPVASIGVAALAYGGADSLHGSGFLAVYLAGLTIGSFPIPARRTVVSFHQALAWVGQIAVFFALGLLVFPSQLGEVVGEGLLLAAVLMFVARPLAAVIATQVGRFSIEERLLVGWAGLRGAVPIVLATFPVIEGVPAGDLFFNIAFFVVVTSTLVQGVTFEPLARAFGLTTTEPALPAPLIEVGTIRRLGAEVIEHPVGEDDAICGRMVRELELPREALVSVIVRQEEAVLPRGSTTLAAGDRLHIVVRQEQRADVEAMFRRWREGPVGAPPLPITTPASRPSVFIARPWFSHDGDPSAPSEVNGIAVAAVLRTRRDRPGALVSLIDGRFAVTGPHLILGGYRALGRYIRDRVDLAALDDQDQAWWQEVAGVLASPMRRPRSAGAEDDRAAGEDDAADDSGGGEDSRTAGS
jgi:potassium/hydrogen antiporter